VSAEELFEDAPCGFLTTAPDGTILRTNRTFASWTGFRPDELRGRRLQDLLSAGGRIYHETHYAPMLRMQGSVQEIAVDFVRADGTRLPALVNSVLATDDEGRPQLVRTTIFDATHRRRYERELLAARDREHRIAEELQRSLLAGDIPADPRLEVGVDYRPAVADLEVGGDWYDAFPTDGGSVALVVGDVVGRGVEAAAVMGQVRSALRALASTGLAPGAVLEGLDGYAERHRVGEMTTVAYADVDLESGALRFASAGHPPPLLVRPGEAPELVMGGRSVPIDAHVLGRTPRADVELALPAGGLLVLYTDGLVERRGQALEDGLRQVVAAVDRLRDRPAAELAAELPRAVLPGDGTRDDVCVVAARRVAR
jgi:phosphoserine phosphatase RsbU/P